jgi:hypothetical protein
MAGILIKVAHVAKPELKGYNTSGEPGGQKRSG